MEKRENNQGQKRAGEEMPVVPEVVFSRDPTDPDYVEIEEPGAGYQPPTSKPSRVVVVVTWVVILGMLGLAALTIVVAVLVR